MSGEPQYTQIKRPVSRVAEKVLGWLNWIGLLLLTVATMFIALVSFSNDTSIQKLEQTLTNNEFAQQVLTNNGLNTTQFVIWLQNGIWAVIVYLIVCLLISFLALISMNIRVLSGILFLIASIITLPLVLLLATVIIPILFFIVAIMMFARKDRVESVPYYPGSYGPYDRDYDYGRDDYYNRPEYDRGRGRYEDDYEDESNRRPRHEPAYEKRDRELAEEEDDTRVYRPEKERGAEADGRYQDEQNPQADYEEEPQFLSRQAKYKQKSADEVKEEQEMDAYEREQARIDEIEGNNESEEEIQNRVNEPRKGETPEEKAARKREKKERKKRAKELRKQRPSAVNQRRMNFEERRSFSQQKSEHPEPEKPEDKTTDNTETPTDDAKEDK
ncbi:membrane protein [Staphylococcus piscifermentans]|uniref:Uncharacterized protein n=1 Tax=Staphylococcus piscifermentans TaxID=70258 RepID=A0A239U8C1_9STAP|nr:DUF4064 domain-containing protein [Staphylococcus piscifermentans]RTX84762.1 DUF4064 domain-containing protein [Staphylococcus piscifermentans]GEP85434.1 hypothetical protein SPI02_20190 [Staphylococcus piscifermentans]SNV06156.1 membrane protein [Staphylococcus piscifermentans]